MEIGARIAAAQLTGSARSKRQIIAGPLVGLLHDDDTWYLSGMLAAEPGQPFDPDEIPWALDTIRQAFSAEGRWLSAELVDEANPGLAEALEANGMTIVSHPPLLVVELDGLTFPELHRRRHDGGGQVGRAAGGGERRVRGGLRGRRRRFRAQAGSRGRRLRPGPRRRYSGCLRFLDRGRRRRHRGRGGRDGPQSPTPRARRARDGVRDAAGLRARRGHARLADAGRRRGRSRVPPARATRRRLPPCTSATPVVTWPIFAERCNPPGPRLRIEGTRESGGAMVDPRSGVRRGSSRRRVGSLRRTAYLVCGDWHRADDCGPGRAVQAVPVLVEGGSQWTTRSICPPRRRQRGPGQRPAPLAPGSADP